MLPLPTAPPMPGAPMAGAADPNDPMRRQLLLQLLRGQSPQPPALPPLFTMPKPYSPPTGSPRHTKGGLL